MFRVIYLHSCLRLLENSNTVPYRYFNFSHNSTHRPNDCLKFCIFHCIDFSMISKKHKKICRDFKKKAKFYNMINAINSTSGNVSTKPKTNKSGKSTASTTNFKCIDNDRRWRRKKCLRKLHDSNPLQATGTKQRPGNDTPTSSVASNLKSSVNSNTNTKFKTPQSTSPFRKNRTKLKGTPMSLNLSVTSTEKINYTLPPKSSQEVSSNWKKLQQVMYKNHPERLRQKLKQLSTFGTKRSAKTTEHIEDQSQNIEEEVQNPIWFDGVDEFLLDVAEKGKQGDENNRCLTPCVAMDCEMVGVGYKAKESILARVSIVNQYGDCVLDRYVKPREDIVDYRTDVSGITPQNVARAHDFASVQKEVWSILDGRILIGHAIKNDLKVLYLSHPRAMIRDTSRYRPFRKMFQNKTPSLKGLSKTMLGVAIQSGQHNSIEDAKAAMKLYTMVHKQWERSFKSHHVPSSSATHSRASSLSVP